MKSKILVDTSVWIEALNNNHSQLKQLILDDFEIAICPTILQEILQGIKDDADFEQVKKQLLNFPVLSLDTTDAALGAASLYRTIRKKGATIRKSNDCLIAFYAIKHNYELLHNDRDFNIIAKHSSLKIYKNTK